MVGDILQPTHLLFVLVVALLVLGPKRLPEVGRALGNGLRDFKAAIDGQSHDDHRDELDDVHRYDVPDEDADKHEFAAHTEPAPSDKHVFAYEDSEPAPRSITSEPVASEAVAPTPATPEPVASETVARQASESEPAATAPVASQPAPSQPVAPQPAAPQPAEPLD